MWFGHAHITVCTVKQFMHHLNKFGICPHNDGCYKTLRATYHRKPCPLYRDRGAPPEEEIPRMEIALVPELSMDKPGVKRTTAQARSLRRRAFAAGPGSVQSGLRPERTLAASHGHAARLRSRP